MYTIVGTKINWFPNTRWPGAIKKKKILTFNIEILVLIKKLFTRKTYAAVQTLAL